MVPPAFTNGPPPSPATVGTFYSFTFAATGSPAPTFTVPAATLPPPLVMSAAGVITGTPTTPGTFTGTVTATNAAGIATQNFSITVNAAGATTVSATMDDGVPQGTRKNPADVINYTAVVSNTGAANATGVQFTDPDVANTTSVANSLTATPVAVDDPYPFTVIANTSIATGMSGFSVVTNDFAGFSGGAAVANAALTITAFDATSTGGGTVSVIASGANVNQRIFIYTSAGMLTANIPLNAGGWLVGQVAAGASFDAVMGVTFPADTASRPAINNATKPGITRAFGSTVTLGNGSNVFGVSLTATGTATALSGAVNTATVGNATTSDVSINNSGGSGAVAFSQSIVVATSTGVVLSNNTGATITFTGGLALNTGANAAFSATGGGTVTATQNNGSIVNTITTTGAALNVTSTTIGASGLTFLSEAFHHSVRDPSGAFPVKV